MPLWAALLAALLLCPVATAAGEPIRFGHSVHEGEVTGAGTLAGLQYLDIHGGSATLSFQEATIEQAWDNRSVQTSEASIAGLNGYRTSRAAGETLFLTTNQDDATLAVFRYGKTAWNLTGPGGTLAPPEAGKSAIVDQTPLPKSGGRLSVPLEGTSRWSGATTDQTTVTGDFWVSLFGWNAVGDAGTSLRTGRYDGVGTEQARVEKVSTAWILVRDGSLTVDFATGTIRDAYVHSPTITTVGTTTLTGLPTQPPRVMEGTTTLAVTSSGDHLEAVVTEGGPAGARPSTTALATPEGSAWMWGGLAAVAFVGLFVFVALSARSVPMLEWRSYHALDRHRPRLASFWANLWTRRDPWDGHAWSARGEARLLMNHDRGAARDFTKAHALLPPEERAVNALHAARAHARVGHATQTAHWIGIVASLDLNVLLTAREEPDFARVWDHASVQRAVQQLLGGA